MHEINYEGQFNLLKVTIERHWCPKRNLNPPVVELQKSGLDLVFLDLHTKSFPYEVDCIPLQGNQRLYSSENIDPEFMSFW